MIVYNDCKHILVTRAVSDPACVPDRNETASSAGPPVYFLKICPLFQRNVFTALLWFLLLWWAACWVDEWLVGWGMVKQPGFFLLLLFRSLMWSVKLCSVSVSQLSWSPLSLKDGALSWDVWSFPCIWPSCIVIQYCSNYTLGWKELAAVRQQL